MDVARLWWWDAVVGEVGPLPPVWREDVGVVVALRGEQDASMAAGVADALAWVSAVDEGDVVADLSQVEFMDAAIVSVLIECREALRLQSRDLRLRAPSRFARRFLELCGVELVDQVPARR